MTTMNINSNSINLYSNAYMALYEVGRAQAQERDRIKTAEAALAMAKDNFAMATNIQQLEERRIAVKVAQEQAEACHAVLDKLVKIQQDILDSIHEQLDSLDVYEAYRHYAVTYTEEARLAYITAFAKSLFDFKDDDIIPVNFVQEYMYFGLARNNAYKNKFTLKAEGKKSFYDKLMRATIDKLIRDDLIDTSKLTFTSKKLAKMESKEKEKQ